MREKQLMNRSWPVRWIAVTDDEVRALDEKTAREWHSSTLND